MAEFLELSGFTKVQAHAITSILADFVMKPEEQIKRELEKAEKEAKKELEKLIGNGSIFEEIGNAIRKGMDAAMKDQEADKNE